MLAFVSYPLSKDLTINLLSIVHMFVSNSTDPVIIQEEEAKLIVLCPNLLWNVYYTPLSSWELDTLSQCWSISLVICEGCLKVE